MVANRIDAHTGAAPQTFRILLERKGLLAGRADQDFKKVLGNHASHSTPSWKSPRSPGVHNGPNPRATDGAAIDESLAGNGSVPKSTTKATKVHEGNPTCGAFVFLRVIL